MYENIFYNREPDFIQLQKIGFKQIAGTYQKEFKIHDNQFVLTVSISSKNVETKVIDKETKFSYTLYGQNNATGFAAQIKSEVLNILEELNQIAFNDATYQTKQAEEIIVYIKQNYQTNLEYLWPKFPEYSIMRRFDTAKWFGGLFILPPEKIKLDGHEPIEILNLRFNSELISDIIDYKTFFPAYHMNKNHWLSVKLSNDKLPTKIKKMIDWSYQNAK